MHYKPKVAMGFVLRTYPKLSSASSFPGQKERNWVFENGTEMGFLGFRIWDFGGKRKPLRH